MEWWLSLCFIAVSTLLALWFVKLLSAGCKNKPTHLPPGPWTLPVIGSLHHIVGALPHRRMMELSRRHGPLMLLKLGEVPTVIVSSAEAAELVMKTNDLAFAGRTRSSPTREIAGCGGKDIFFAPYGDHWRQMRKVCVMELLSSKQVKRMEGIRAQEVGHLLRSITASKGTTFNVSRKVTALSNDLVSRAVFGAKFAEQEDCIQALDEVLTLLGGFCMADLFPSSRLVRLLSNGERHMKRSYGCIQRIISNIIEGRKGAPRSSDSTYGDEDLLDVLLRLQEEHSLEFPLTTEAICAVLFDLFAGATETTGSALEWVMSELVCNPECMARAQQEVREVLGEDRVIITNSDLAELHYMRMVIKEAIRLHPPGPLIPRSAREDCTIAGYDIPKDTNVYINVFAVSQDPQYWENPQQFKPERFENNNVGYNGAYFEFIPFGVGRRQCPGIQFSSSIMEIALTNFLYHFDWKLPDGVSLASFDMSEKFGLAVSRRHDLQLRAIPHVWLNTMSSK